MRRHRRTRTGQQPGADEVAQQEGGGVHQAGVGGNVLAEDRGDQEMGSAGGAPYGEADQFGQGRSGGALSVGKRDVQAVGDPRTRPEAHQRTSAASRRSTKPTSSPATPKTWARRRSRSAQALWGLASFILLA